MHFDVVRLSSKGQLVIPRHVRDRLGLRTGTKLALFTDAKNIMLKPIPAPRLPAFRKKLTRV